MIKLSKWAKTHNLSYTTAYNMFKRGDLPAKATQLESGTILVEEDKGVCCKVTDVLGKRDFYISINVELDKCVVSEADKKEILNMVKVLANLMAHKMNYRIDENSIKIF